MSTRDEELKKIAKNILGLDTLKTRHADDLDFHELSVWQIKSALQRAYIAGLLNCKTKDKE